MPGAKAPVLNFPFTVMLPAGRGSSRASPPAKLAWAARACRLPSAMASREL